MIAWASNASGRRARAAKNANPDGRLGPSKVQMDRSREISMPHISQIRTCPPVAASAAVGLLALALACAALPTQAADTPPKPTTDTAVKTKALPPSVQI